MSTKLIILDIINARAANNICNKNIRIQYKISATPFRISDLMDLQALNEIKMIAFYQHHVCHDRQLWKVPAAAFIRKRGFVQFLPL